MAMRSAEAVGIIEAAIDYILLMRESSGEKSGERELVKDLERVIEFIQGARR